MKIVLLKERPMSWNKMYAGVHWTTRRDEVMRVHWLVKLAASKEKEIKKKVDIFITAYFDKMPLDSDNIPAKLYVDGLRMNILKDDNRTWVRKVTTLSEVDIINPRVEIDIEEIT